MVQLRGPEAIAQRLLAQAGLSQQGEPLQDACPADALLLVSGSHALRPALSWTGALQVQSPMCLADTTSTMAPLDGCVQGSGLAPLPSGHSGVTRSSASPMLNAHIAGVAHGVCPM